MSKKNPYRSRRGCLTCKRRKKKCDETKPRCTRCKNANFDCLGYDYLDTPGASTSKGDINSLEHYETIAAKFSGFLGTQPSEGSPSSFELGGDNLSFPIERGCAQTQMWDSWPGGIRIYRRARPTIPRSMQIDPLELDNMVQFIVVQQSRVPQQVMFRPFPFSIQSATANFIRRSPYARWPMYIGARIFQAMLDGVSWHPYIGWIGDFHHRISNIPCKPESDIEELVARLDALQGISTSAFMVLGNNAGYALYKHCTPLILQVAIRFPEVWTTGSAISISTAYRRAPNAFSRFIFADTFMSLALGVPTFLHYDTALDSEGWSRNESVGSPEWLYGWPPIMIILLARLNSSRVSRQLNQIPMIQSEQVEIEQCLDQWRPTIDHPSDQSSGRIMKLAIQECWRHAVLIYMYMGACGTDSADPRVEASVCQVAQLASTVEDGNPLEVHLLIPCLIAGAAARKERHRKVLRRKISAPQIINHFLLRAVDFAHVLDHLWLGAGSGGRAVRWDDYVDSRSATLPIDTLCA